MADARAHRHFQPAFDKLQCSMLDAVMRIEEMKAVFEATCPCGELAIACDVHGAEAVDKVELVLPASTKENGDV